MKKEWTNQEKQSINHAFSLLLWANESNSSKTRDIEEALRIDKKERSSIQTAKVVLLEAWEDGFNGKHPNGETLQVADLQGLCYGARLMTVLGADNRKSFIYAVQNKQEYQIEQFNKLIDAAKQIRELNRVATDRFLEDLRNESEGK